MTRGKSYHGLSGWIAWLSARKLYLWNIGKASSVIWMSKISKKKCKYIPSLILNGCIFVLDIVIAKEVRAFCHY